MTRRLLPTFSACSRAVVLAPLARALARLLLPVMLPNYWPFACDNLTRRERRAVHAALRRLRLQRTAARYTSVGQVGTLPRLHVVPVTPKYVLLVREEEARLKVVALIRPELLRQFATA